MADVSLVACVARNGTIGRAGRLPWHLPDDLARFRRLTLGHAVVMGRRTFESIGRPLPGRRNLVLSRTLRRPPPGAALHRSLADALAACDGEEFFVIGGRAVYEAALPLARRIHLTEVLADVHGDVAFPRFDRRLFRETAREEHPADERHAHPFRFLTLERIRS